MGSTSHSGERRLSAAELQTLFKQFTDAIATDTRLSQQLTTWAEARRLWRSNWASRATIPPDLIFQRLVPNPPSASQDCWVHPMADEAAELAVWRAAWNAGTRAERNELAAGFVRAIAEIEGDPASAAAACVRLSHSAGQRGVPLAALTPALSSLDPVRFVAVCDGWLVALGQYEGTAVPNDIAVYPDVNTIALRWLAAAEGDSPAPVLAACPPADRVGVFCGWVVRTASDAARARTFDVTRKKYKEWPPMW